MGPVTFSSNVPIYVAAPTDALTVQPPELPEIEAIAADSFSTSRKIQSASEIEQVEKLQTLYTGQINARLARLLEEFHVAREGNSSDCIVQVIQDERGNVLDVTTDECIVTNEWRERLVQVIRGASPLPLPPEGLAMGSYLTLDLSTL